MAFPRGHIDKHLQYEYCGHILADTAINMGYEISTDTRTRWGNTMSCLVDVDFIAEKSPSETFDSISMLKVFGMETATPEVIKACSELCSAMIDSPLTTNIDNYYTSRCNEASKTLSVLRVQSPEELQEQAHLWQQLSAIASLGILLDSLVDAHEDAKELVFTERELVVGAFKHALEVIHDVRPKTWMSIIKASHEKGLNYSMIRKSTVFTVTRMWRLQSRQSSAY